MAPKSRLTLTDVYEAIVDVREKVELLREHVNDEQDKMLLLLKGHTAQIAVLEKDKIDRDSLPIELFKSLGFRLMNKNVIRWAIGAAAAWIVGSVVWFQGPGAAQTAARLFLHFFTHL